jgi:hypothetical protein
MPRDFFDATPEEQKVILIDAAILSKAEELIESCEGCNPDGAQIPFDNILDRITGSDPSVAITFWKNRRSVRTVGLRFSKRPWLNRRNG